MLDRVREALFSTLAPWLDGAFVLDLFAGSGSLGLEALSRGARAARFVERGGRASACLGENVQQLGFGEVAEIVRGDALSPRSWGVEPADVVFLDPPYPLLEELRSRRAVFGALEALVRAHLAPQGVLVFHAPKAMVLRSELTSGLACRERTYGSNALWYVQAGGEDE
jgi:16S rRNA (guanine966-N2)-methyltransferase